MNLFWEKQMERMHNIGIFQEIAFSGRNETLFIMHSFFPSAKFKFIIKRMGSV